MYVYVAATFCDNKHLLYLQTPHHSLVPEVDPVYAKYPITHKTRFCEMYMVVDHEIVSILYYHFVLDHQFVFSLYIFIFIIAFSSESK